MKVGELTTQEKESLIGQMVEQDWYFNPFLSYNTTEGIWVISTQEIDGSIFPENEWVKELPLIDYVPLPNPTGLTENI